MNSLTQAQWTSIAAAAAAGDTVAYYTMLWQQGGDPYARLALEVQLDQTINGRVANRYMQIAAEEELGRSLTREDLQDFRAALMRADLNARVNAVGADSLGSLTGGIDADALARSPELSGENGVRVDFRAEVA